MYLIISNSSLAHIEESKSFQKSIEKVGHKSILFITDNGKHRVGSLGLTKLFNNINLFKVFSILKIISKNSIKKIIITAPIPLFFFIIPIIKLYKIRLIYTFHEPFLNQKNVYSLISNLFHKFFIPFTDILIFFSNHSKHRFTSLNKRYNGKIFVFPLYKYRKKIDKPYPVYRKEYISFIGNIGKNKNLNYFLDIAKSLPNQKFLLASSGNISNYFDKISKLKNLKIINRFLTEEEYYFFIDRSLYVLLPYSSTSQSGVLIDVMCRGSIVVGTNTGSFPEIVKNGKNGFVLNYSEFVIDFIKIYKNSNKEKINEVCFEALSYYNSNMSFENFLSKFKQMEITK
ncbi:MAG: hypothetical protein CMC04_07660 [Flavobacteriaceae bacterium]|nr:hypothetical protein [Flavobacteriaceae bacterium]|tara:strand:+ start:24597 stop:25625 length:1029 start_codon:yes stop_codon:yes gene_type:complete